MKAHQFYQVMSDTNHAVPITLLTSTAYAGVTGFSEHEQRMLVGMQFTAKPGEVALLWDKQGHLSKVCIGVGDGTDAAAMAAAVLKLPAGVYHIAHPLSDHAVLLWALAQYQFVQFQKVLPMPRILAVHPESIAAVEAKADAIFTVRDLINMPANILNPETLAGFAEDLAATLQANCQVLVGDDLLIHRYPAIYAVGRAAASAPRLIHLAWGDVAHPHVTLVGKGVCFDSGGLDLKNASGMRLMKKDMGGAAHVLGLAKWMIREELPIYLQVLIPAVENAVGEHAYRPGDVLIMRNGMSVEIENTDAEGRLILADALTKACEHPPELLIDFATLTGAARVAVGTEIAALFSNNDALAAKLQQYGVDCVDPIWQLPLYAGYQSMFESTIADLMNSSTSAYAGATVAALFLQYFVKPDIDWLHFDIMAWNLSNKPGKPEGGEAMGILALGQYLIDRYRVGKLSSVKPV